MSEPPSDEVAFRVGSAAVGLFAGLALGLLLAVGSFVVLGAATIPLFVFGGAAVGVLLGFVLPEAARTLGEGAVHFLIGLLSSATWGEVNPDQESPHWLKVVFWLGVATGIVALALLHS